MTDETTGIEAPSDPWTGLRLTTQARIGLGRVGNSLPTRHALDFQAAHSAARDAVHEPLDVGALADQVAELEGATVHHIRSQAADRIQYLRRPDLGRLPQDLSQLSATSADVGIVLADGLSPHALALHGAGMLQALLSTIRGRFSVADPVVATQARVALGDHIGQALGVQTVLVIIGERPGLSVADSLGIYLTHLPRPGRNDAQRNCVSNIHPPEGLSYEDAASIVVRLLAGAQRIGESGVALKDTSPADARPRSPIDGP